MLVPGKAIYEGAFVEGKFCGRGRLINKCGDLYEGDFVDNVF